MKMRCHCTLWKKFGDLLPGSLPQTSVSHAVGSPDTSLPNVLWMNVFCLNNFHHIAGFDCKHSSAAQSKQQCWQSSDCVCEGFRVRIVRASWTIIMNLCPKGKASLGRGGFVFACVRVWSMCTCVCVFVCVAIVCVQMHVHVHTEAGDWCLVSSSLYLHLT